MNRTQAVQDKPFDVDEWQKLYYRHQQQYIRHRLEAVKLLHQGSSRTQVCEQIGCSYDTLTSWSDKYLNGGLSELVSPIRHSIAEPVVGGTTTATQKDGFNPTTHRLWD
jgi:hypothetical protein